MRAFPFALSVAALMAVPALAQEATDPPAEQSEPTGGQPTTGGDAAAPGAADQPAATEPAATEPATGETATEGAATGTAETGAAETGTAETGTVVTETTEAPAADAAAAPLGLEEAVARLQDAASQISTAASDQTALTAEGTVDPNSPGMRDAREQATQALDDFEAALGQSAGEGDEDAQAQAEELRAQVEQARQQLEEDPQAAGETIQEISQTMMQQAQADIPADADRIMGRKLVTTDGEEVGEVSDVLVTADGQVEALLVKRGGALGMGGQQVAVGWDRIQIQGDQLVVDMASDEVEMLPEYVVE